MPDDKKNELQNELLYTPAAPLVSTPPPGYSTAPPPVSQGPVYQPPRPPPVPTSGQLPPLPRFSAAEAWGQKIRADIAAGKMRSTRSESARTGEQTTTARVLPAEELRRYDAAARDYAEQRGRLAEYEARGRDEARQIELQKPIAERMSAADRAELASDYEATRAPIVEEIERERARPDNDFWETRTASQKAAVAVAAALGGLGAAITSGKNLGLEALDSAISDHLRAREERIRRAYAALGREEDFYRQRDAILEREREAALRQIDYQVRDAIARGTNPVIRERIAAPAPAPAPTAPAEAAPPPAKAKGGTPARSNASAPAPPKGRLSGAEVKEILRRLAEEDRAVRTSIGAR
jgi:hypothetical protein